MDSAPLYRVRVWDNFHYMDEDEAYDHGTFETYDEALAAAQKIVAESVVEHAFDMGQYAMFGDDPGIICPSGTDHPVFSARGYARQLCEEHEKSNS